MRWRARAPRFAGPAPRPPAHQPATSPPWAARSCAEPLVEGGCEGRGARAWGGWERACPRCGARFNTTGRARGGSFLLPSLSPPRAPVPGPSPQAWRGGGDALPVPVGWAAARVMRAWAGMSEIESRAKIKKISDWARQAWLREQRVIETSDEHLGAHPSTQIPTARITTRHNSHAHTLAHSHTHRWRKLKRKKKNNDRQERKGQGRLHFVF